MAGITVFAYTTTASSVATGTRYEERRRPRVREVEVCTQSNCRGDCGIGGVADGAL